MKDVKDTTMWWLLVRLMEMDTAKHIEILNSSSITPASRWPDRFGPRPPLSRSVMRPGGFPVEAVRSGGGVGVRGGAR